MGRVEILLIHMKHLPTIFDSTIENVVSCDAVLVCSFSFAYFFLESISNISLHISNIFKNLSQIGFEVMCLLLSSHFMIRHARYVATRASLAPDLKFYFWFFFLFAFLMNHMVPFHLGSCYYCDRWFFLVFDFFCCWNFNW